MARDFRVPDRKQRVRPATDQSNRSAHGTTERTNTNSNTARRKGEWVSHYPLTEGMTGKQIAKTFAVCLLALIAGMLLLDGFAWCVGHFVKGWW